ncbi:MAG: hypothetical protein JW954_00250 [Dehalococcoidaceae bacterium]|nr:hypothetical protein [Dehalococcoidaceae bacterium]
MKKEALQFSAPYNNDPASLEDLFKLKTFHGNCITEIYLSGPQDYSGSGRITSQINREDFFNSIDSIHIHGIQANLVINTTCAGREWYSKASLGSLFSFIQEAQEKHNLKALTVANPIIMAEIHNAFPDIEISASVLGDIDSVERAEVFREAGASVITPDVNINRDLDLLGKIKSATGARLKLMLNEGCLYRCPFRKFHFNYISHQSKELGPVEGDALFANCSRLTLKDLSLIFKSCWIRPEDMREYGEITSFFKIVGRTRPASFVKRATRAYMSEEWDGDLLDILSSSLNKLGLEHGASVRNKELTKYDFFNMSASTDEAGKNEFYRQLARELVHFKVLTRGKLEDLNMADMADNLKIKY